jgi:hypothetical protein
VEVEVGKIDMERRHDLRRHQAGDDREDDPPGERAVPSNRG